MSITMLIPLLVTAVGTFLLFRLKFFFLIHPIRTMREFLNALKERNARRSLCLALAGTLGVGNIFGVSAGIMIGGAGSLFWLLFSSIFAMIIKYAEILLVFDGKTARGGSSAVLKEAFKKAGVLLSLTYAFATVLLALFMGASMQSAAVFDVAEQTAGLPSVITALLLVALITPCLLGGARKIENITEIIIPLTTIIYIILCFCVILKNFTKLDDVFFMIISSALVPESAMGGMAALAIKEGFARGILSNEAGVGMSAMAHSRSKGRAPHIAGLFGMCEVFFDSVVLCMLTGIAVLVSVESPAAFSTPMALVFSAFKTGLGDFCASLLFPIIFAFAYSTIICWYYYGSECMSVYFPHKKRIFLPLFVIFILLSAVISSKILLSAIDVLLLFMSLMILSAVIKKSDRIACLSIKKEPE